jgi:ABC-2 type transport system ATP-binding protein
MPVSPVLELIEARKTYGAVVAVDGLSLAVAAGEVYCLLGPNGAGKTTTLNLLLGFEQPDRGQVRVAGHDVAQDPASARWYLAYLPEQVALYPALDAFENLGYFAALAGRKLSRAEAASCLSEVGLPPTAWSSRISGYSKGMRQKVGIAIALSRQARALLLDEPTSGLDPNASDEFSALISGLAERGMAILMATHDLFRAKALGRRFGVMHQGRLMREFDPSGFSFEQIEAIYRDSTGHAAREPSRSATLSVPEPSRTASSRPLHGPRSR